MKGRISWMLPFAFLCFCSVFMMKGTEVHAAMADLAEDYELGETYSGYVNGTYGETNETYGERYFKFLIKEKSHVTLYCEYKDTGYGGSIYNSNGKLVLKAQDIQFSKNGATGWSAGNQYRVLTPGTYYLEIPDNGMWGIKSFEFKFRIQAEKQIKLPKGSIRSLKSKKRGKMTVTYNPAPNAIGFRIQYATNERFSKNKKTIYVAGTTRTISGLKKGTRYYVKICPYTVYDDGTRVFGQNSLVRTVVVKK